MLNYGRSIGKDVPEDDKVVAQSSALPSFTSVRKRKSVSTISSKTTTTSTSNAVVTKLIDVTSEDANEALDTFLLKWAHRRPKHYLAVIGHTLVLAELVALLTPAIAMGLQWTTALCNKHSLVALFEVLSFALSCLFKGACEPDFRHCVLN